MAEPFFNYPRNQFHPAQIPAIKRLLDLSKAKRVVEVGSWLGESTSIIADYIKPGKVYSVDNFMGNVGTSLEEAAKNKDIYEIFDNNLKILELRQYVHPFIMDSIEASSYFYNNSMDLIFIDASHDYNSVKKDISAWFPIVREGGIICGHDCESREWDDKYIDIDVFDHKHHGVIKAVNEAFSDFNIDERIWWVWKK